MLSIGASYGHVRVQQENLKNRIRKKGSTVEKIGKGSTTKIHPAGSSPAKKLAAGDR
ncbi:hypothetical protein KFK09_025485 [Dendrobium nobile]|uniref:Uncharacterized protein n=1 Tax=Dendrobium nobile TaxID=94219 RepID=A0A8T3AM92_DENNO|nr:hypothetical protein KFK09_025485 [Dendrobium nobile]